MTKLHLGCGTRYLDGYVNIDHPPSEHTVQHALVADRYADITELIYPTGTIDEVRLHHVFEHFPRQITMALLCQWTDWLKPGGLLRIETPDVMASAWALVSPMTSSGARHQIIRHLFGSHEAGWAAHWDGWYKDRFRHTLTALGFRNLKFVRNRWGATRNIEVLATRGDKTFTLEDYRGIVEELLAKSLVTHGSKWSRKTAAGSERVMLDVWMREWEHAYTSVLENADRPERGA
ncbi:MAG: hypothetical protein V4563_00380 [Pseudomonadota bacterium]